MMLLNDYDPVLDITVPGFLFSDQVPVHVWYLNWRKHADKLDMVITALRKDEKAEFLRFRQFEDRFRYVWGRYLLRTLLSHYLNLGKDEISFTRGVFGKPCLSANVPLPGLSFNLSHSGEYVAAAVSRTDTVGIDIESVRDMPELDLIARNEFHDAEQEQMRRCKTEEKLDCFYKIWVSKEAYLKALGSGLSKDMKSFCFEENGDGVFVHDSERGKVPCRKEEFGIGSAVVGAVVAADIRAGGRNR
ncbi:MAG: 4'-phosphopantetheinyl transferase family protein [Lachnospiraceae bacterium]